MSYNVETLKAGDLALLIRKPRHHITDIALCVVITDEITNERKFLPLFSDCYSQMPRQSIFPTVRDRKEIKTLCYRVKDFGDNGVLVHPTTGTKITIEAYKIMRDEEKIEFLLDFDKFITTASHILGVCFTKNEETLKKYFEYFKKNIVWDYIREKEVVEVPVDTLKELLEAINGVPNISIFFGVNPPSNDNIDPE